MRSCFPYLIIIILLLPAFSFAQEPQVSIYSAADELRYGQTLNRGSKDTVNLTDFLAADSADTESGGIQTAVIVDARVKDALDSLLKEKEFIFVENSVLMRTEIGGLSAYGFSWNEYDFEIVFTLEKADDVISGVIESTYSRNSYLLGEVRRSYSDNYAVKIFRADDLFHRGGLCIDFKEAMIAATVIGDSYQPLLGIHDGLGVLSQIGLVTARIDIVSEGALLEYRQPEIADKEFRSFIHSITGKQGDFVDNLFTSVSEIFLKHSLDDEILLPEEFFIQKEGDDTDYALLYYDVLKRAGYQVKFIVIDEGSVDGRLFSTVFFREAGTDLWGRIDGQVLEREKASRLNRLPALVFSASVKYFEPDIDVLFETSVIQLPPPSKWRTSLY
jgi:hypothetical protein